MAKQTRNSRLARVHRLQDTQGGENCFGADYRPACGFTPREQPGISRPSAIRVAKIPGRDLIAQSKQERPLLLLAAYHPHVFEIQELKMLSPVPRVHPLVGHPLADGWQYAPLRGTLDVADRLGILSRHPKVWRPEDGSRRGEWVPVPFIGDDLIFLAPPSVKPYAVNWTVKLDDESFTRRANQKSPRPRDPPPDPKEIQRHEIEEIYYLDGDIPTYRITYKTVAEEVKVNLEDLVTWHNRELLQPVDARVEIAMIERANRLVGKRWTMTALVRALVREFSVGEYDTKIVVKRAIWNRKVRVDLFRRLRDDEPLWPEQRDVIDVYAHLFAGL